MAAKSKMEGNDRQLDRIEIENWLQVCGCMMSGAGRLFYLALELNEIYCRSRRQRTFMILERLEMFSPNQPGYVQHPVMKEYCGQGQDRVRQAVVSLQ